MGDIEQACDVERLVNLMQSMPGDLRFNAIDESLSFSELIYVQLIDLFSSLLAIDIVIELVTKERLYRLDISRVIAE